MRSKSFFAVLVLVMMFSFMTGLAFSDEGGMRRGKEFRHNKGFEDTILFRFHMVLKSKDEIGLTDEQVEKIKALKVETKKALIKQNADIEVIDVDIQSAMWDKSIDVNAVNKLIDQKYDLKKAKAKILVKAAADFKEILTDEQKEKCKELHKERKEAFMKGRKGGQYGEKCPKGPAKE